MITFHKRAAPPVGVLYTNDKAFKSIFSADNNTVWQRIDPQKVINYLALNDDLGNFYTLYYDKMIRVKNKRVTLIPSANTKGQLCISLSDYARYSFYDYVALILHSSLIIKSDIAKRVISFKDEINKESTVEHDLLNWCVEAEINSQILMHPLTVHDEMSDDIRNNTFKEHGNPVTNVRKFEEAYILLAGEIESENLRPNANIKVPATPMDDISGNASHDNADGDILSDGIDSHIDGNDPDNGHGDDYRVDKNEDIEETGGENEIPNKESDLDSEEAINTEQLVEITIPVKSLAKIDGSYESIILENNDNDKDSPGCGFNHTGGQNHKKTIPEESKGLHEVLSLILEGSLEGDSDEKGAKRRKELGCWAGYHTRYAALQKKLGTAKLQPRKRLVDNSDRSHSKAKVAIYLDTSGSCASWSRKLFNLIHNMDRKRFEISLYSFSDDVTEHDVEEDEFCYRQGGTSIANVLRHAKKNDIEENHDAVIILTDADFYTKVHDHAQEDQWHWVLTETRYHPLRLPKARNKYFL